MKYTNNIYLHLEPKQNIYQPVIPSFKPKTEVVSYKEHKYSNVQPSVIHNVPKDHPDEIHSKFMSQSKLNLFDYTSLLTLKMI